MYMYVCMNVCNLCTNTNTYVCICVVHLTILSMQKTKSPDLVPEDADPSWQAGSEKIVSSSKDLKHKISGFINQMNDQLGDPRIGPALLLVALILFGRTWLQRSQTTPKNEPNSSNQLSDKVSDSNCLLLI